MSSHWFDQPAGPSPLVLEVVLLVETFSPTAVSPILQQFLNQLGPIPACVVDARLNVVAGNTATRVVFGDFAAPSEGERNLIWRLFTYPVPQQESEEWKKIARVFLAQFRAEYGRFIKDPWWAKQIAELNRISPLFRELWARHDVLNALEGRKAMRHPLVGELAFDFLFFQTVDSSDLRLLIYTPRSNFGTADKIERLLALDSEKNAQNTRRDLSSCSLSE